MNIKFVKLFGYALRMSVNADNKFQLHIFPIDRVTALNVHKILVYKFKVW